VLSHRVHRSQDCLQSTVDSLMVGDLRSMLECLWCSRCCSVPPILLASIAMQESTCNPGTVGGAGEQGLMQITPDKCGGAPGGDCQDPVSISVYPETALNGNLFRTSMLGQVQSFSLTR